MTKGSTTNNQFAERKGHVMLSVKENICTLKNKLTCKSVKSIFSEHEIKSTTIFFKKYFLIVPIDMLSSGNISMPKLF